MPTADDESEETEHSVTRRTMLRGAAVGLAGAGFAGTASATDWRKVRFKSVSEQNFEYHVSVSGKLEREPNNDGYDTLIDENSAKGAAANGGYDDWRFTGHVTKLKLSGPGKVIVDGEVVRDTTTDDHDMAFKKLRFQSADHGTFRYRASVSGTLKREPNNDGYDTQIDGNSAKGAAADGGFDDWRFSGHVTQLELSGPGQVIIDGEVVADTTKDDHDQLTKEVIVSSPKTDKSLEYTFDVTGNLKKLEPNEDGGRATDEVVDRGDRVRVNGAVGTGNDRFAFSGDLIPVHIPDGVELDIRHL